VLSNRRFLAAVGMACAACTAAPDARETASPTAANAVSHPEWSRNAAIYEVNVRQFTPEGTFAAMQKHLPRLDSLGVDILWLMPVQPIGKKNRKGSLGSYYSIADYTSTNPEFGTKTDFKALVGAAHGLGLKVILDWVPNHTAFDHPWTTQHKSYYTLRPDGSISVARDNDGKETDWTDVADLNYDNREMRRAMIDAMKWWVDSMNVDGFRVDVAWGVPSDFWAEMRPALTAARADLFFLAEAEDPKLHQWFDMTYGWEFHHTLNDITKGQKSTTVLDEYFEKQARTYPADAFRMYFTSNHDENSWQGTEFERMGANHLAAFVLAATIQNGMPLLYTGQEVSMNKRLRFFEKDTVDWKGQSLAGFYRRLFELKESQPALANGASGGTQSRIDIKLTNVKDHLRDDSRIYAFGRVKDSNVVVVVVNFGDQLASLSVPDTKWAGNYRDMFNRSNPAMLGVQGGYLRVPAHGYRVLVRE
ncbi:MAG: alpha-amylase family glycosyl hydrolase, partial [Gemmatimonadaceae bacterium]